MAIQCDDIAIVIRHQRNIQYNQSYPILRYIEEQRIPNIGNPMDSKLPKSIYGVFLIRWHRGRLLRTPYRSTTRITVIPDPIHPIYSLAIWRTWKKRNHNGRIRKRHQSDCIQQRYHNELQACGTYIDYIQKMVYNQRNGICPGEKRMYACDPGVCLV